MKTATYADAAVSYTYDAASRATRIDDTQSGSVQWSYDDANRVLSETTGAGTVVYQYNGASQRISMTAADRPPVTYLYDAAGRLQTITQASEVFTYGYDVLSRRSTLQRPNGVITSYSYDGLDRLARLIHQKTGNSPIEDLRYTHSLEDEIDSTTSLASAALLPLAKPASAADAANRIAQLGSATYSFDNAGQTTSRTDGQGATQFTWDARGRLTQATMPNGQVISYSYDALGRRASRAAGGLTTTFTYDGADVVLDRASDNSSVDYLNGDGIDEKLRQTSPAGPLYFIQNHLASTAALTDASGSVVERTQYDAYGQSAGSSLTRYGFTGRESDSLAGLIYYRARYYDAGLGRFISEDPSRFESSMNFYVYVDDNPVNSVDPEGLDRVWVCFRSLNRPYLKPWRHTFIKIETDNGETHTWGVLGDLGKTTNQKVYKDDFGTAKDPRNDPKRAECIPVPGYITNCQIDYLIKRLDAAWKAETCPSCMENYKLVFATDLLHLFDGFNSNTFSYNMLTGAGMTPPPISRAPGYHADQGKWYP